MNETSLLPDFLTDFFYGLLGYTGPAQGPGAYTLSRERHVEVDGKFADAVLGRFQKDNPQFIAALEGKGTRDPLDRPFSGRRMSALNDPRRKALIRFWEAWQDELYRLRILDLVWGSGAIATEAFTQPHASRSDKPHRREERADAARISGEQGQMSDIRVRADEEVRRRACFLPTRPTVLLEGFPGLKGSVEQ